MKSRRTIKLSKKMLSTKTSLALSPRVFDCIRGDAQWCVVSLWPSVCLSMSMSRGDLDSECVWVCVVECVSLCMCIFVSLSVKM